MYHAKQKELQELKALRAKALADEEKAIKAQRAVDTLSQVSSLVTASAKIFKSLAEAGPIGVAIAVATIASMFASFALFKVKASQATKFAKGGWTGDGSQRDETGERVAGTVHEREFVVRKGPAHRFRDVLEAINREDKRAIFNSFNRLSPDLLGGSTINNVVVQNDGPNKRIDETNSLLRRLSGREEIITQGNKTIIKKGSSIRIIRNGITR